MQTRKQTSKQAKEQTSKVTIIITIIIIIIIINFKCQGRYLAYRHYYVTMYWDLKCTVKNTN